MGVSGAGSGGPISTSGPDRASPTGRLRGEGEATFFLCRNIDLAKNDAAPLGALNGRGVETPGRPPLLVERREDGTGERALWRHGGGGSVSAPIQVWAPPTREQGSSTKTPRTVMSDSSRSPRLSAARRVARAARVHDAPFRPAPVVLWRAVRDVVRGRDLLPPDPPADDESRPAEPPVLALPVGPSNPATEAAPDTARSGLDHPSIRQCRAALVLTTAVAAAVLTWSVPTGPEGERSAAVSAVGVAVDQARAGASAAGGPSRPGSALPLLAGPPRVGVTRPEAAPVSGPRVLASGRARRPPRWRPELPPGLPVGAPVVGPVSSAVGVRVHPVTRKRRAHAGTDFAVPLGTPVRATASGRVRSVGHRAGYGLTVELDHRDPSGLRTSTLYAHLLSVPATADVGAVVGRGDVVGRSGGVGPGAGLSTGPHVHYEVRLHGDPSGPVAVRPDAFHDRVRSWRVRRAASRTWGAPTDDADDDATRRRDLPGRGAQ